MSFSVYFCFHAEDEDECIRLITMRLQEEGLPDWIYDDAQEIKIEEMATFTRMKEYMIYTDSGIEFGVFGVSENEARETAEEIINSDNDYPCC